MWGKEAQKHTFGEIWPLWYREQGLRNRRGAVKRLKPLSDQGYAPAQFSLGLAYFDGDGVRRNYAKAFEWFLAAAEQVYPGAEGMVGNFYITAKPAYNVCDYNLEAAARWHLLAAEHGNSGAQYNLAFSYWTGRGMVKDAVEAYVWANLSVHCSTIRSRMAEVLRDQAAFEIEPQNRAAADRRVVELSSRLPHPWSEPMLYWRLLAERAGAIPPAASV